MLDWNFDPAASGHRWRAFPGDGWELAAYEDGRWYVSYRLGVQLDGEAANLEAAKTATALTYATLRQLRQKLKTEDKP